MAIAFGAAGTRLLVGTAGTSWAVPYPAGIAAGDLLVLHIVTNGGAVTTPAGWTAVYNETVLANPKGGLFIAVAAGTESGNLTVTTASTTGNAMMFRYTGVEAATPQDAAATSVSLDATTDTTVDLPAITTVTANTMLVYADGANSGTVTMTGPAGSTERVDQGTLAGTGAKAGALYDEAVAAAGSTGTRIITLSAGRAYWGVMLALRPSSGAPVAGTGTLTQRIVGIPANPATEGRVKVKVASTTSARLICATNSAMTTGIVNGAAAVPDADGNATLTATGLASNTRYYFRVEMTDAASNIAIDSMATIGRLKTAPVGQANFAFDFGSCANSTDPPVFPLIVARNDDLFFHLGDMFYNDGSGTTVANLRTRLNGKIQSANHAALYAQVNMAHTAGDHDVAENGTTNATSPTAWANWRQVSAELFPDPALYYTFVWGRVRFIKVDTRNYKSDPAAADDSAKTALGTTQKQWLKDTITAATEPLIIVLQGDPWVGAAVAGDDTWFGFSTERTELGNHFAASGKNIIMCGGDMHAVAAHDGISGSPGGIAVFQAAAFNQTASVKGGPWTVGPIPASGTAVVSHYGRVVITDTGTAISAAFTGYDSADVAQVTLTKTYSLNVNVTATPTGIASGETFGTVAEHWQESYTFDDGTSQGWTASAAGSGTLAISAAAAHDGAYGASSNVPAATVDKAGYTRTIPATKQAIIRGWWKVTTEGASGSNVPFARMFDGATRIADVYRENVAGTIWLRVTKAAGGANYWFTSTGLVLPLNTWVYVSFQWGLDGKPEVFVNGTRYISQAQIPADWLAATDITTAWLGSHEQGNAGAWNIDTVEVLGRGYATGEARQLPILTGEQFGTTSALPAQLLTPGGIASDEAFGVPAATQQGILAPTGIASAEAFGTPVLSAVLTSTPTTVPTAEAFGVPAATVSAAATPTGIGTAEAFGIATATNPGVPQPTGIPSAEAFGTPASVISAEVQPAGIPSAEAFGAGLYMTGLLTSAPGGIASAEATGTPAATVHAVLTASGIGSAEAFGAPAADVKSLLTAVGIGTAEAFGSTLHTGTLPTAPGSVGSAEAFGTAVATVLAGSSNPQPTGIGSAEAFGSPVMGGSYTATGSGIGTAETFGTHRNESLLTSVPASFSDPDAFGSPSWVGLWVMQPTGIASGLAWGIPANVATITLTPTGIASGEAFGTSTEQGLLLVAPLTMASLEAFGTAVETGLLTSVPSGIGSAFASGFPILTVSLTAVPVGISDPNAYGTPSATVLAFTGRDLVLELIPADKRWHVRANHGGRMELEPSPSRFDTEENPARFEFAPAADRFDREGGL